MSESGSHWAGPWASCSGPVFAARNRSAPNALPCIGYTKPEEGSHDLTSVTREQLSNTRELKANGQEPKVRAKSWQLSSSMAEKGVHHGTTRAGCNLSPGQSQRLD